MKYLILILFLLQGCGDEAGSDAVAEEVLVEEKSERKAAVEETETVISEFATEEIELVNTAPTFELIDDVAVDENALVFLNLFATDAEGDDLTYSCITNCDLLEAYIGLVDGVEYEQWQLESTTGLFAWIPTHYEAGDYDLTFEVSDGELTDEVTLRVTINDVNRAPYFFNFPPTQTLAQGATYNRAMQVMDSDGGSLTVSLASAVANASVVGGNFSFTPDGTQSGEIVFDFEVTDGTAVATKSLSIFVDAVVVNSAPVLAAIGAKNVKESEDLDFTASATDANGGDTLTISASGLPAGATFVANQFAWTPSCSQEGDYNVTISVSDGTVSSSEIVPITVLHKNCGVPAWTTRPSIASSSGNQVTINVGIAQDADGAVTYGYVKEYDCNNKDWTQAFNTVSRMLTVTNTFAQGSVAQPDQGSHWFLVYAQDTDGNRNYQLVKAVGDTVSGFTGGYRDGQSTAGLCGANGTIYAH